MTNWDAATSWIFVGSRLATSAPVMGSGVIIDRSSTPLGVSRIVGSVGGIGLCQDKGRNWGLFSCDQEDECSIMMCSVEIFGFSHEKETPPSFPVLSLCVKGSLERPSALTAFRDREDANSDRLCPCM